MRYCTKCKILTRDHEKCPFCSRKTIDNPSHFSPVRIITANGFELERIRAALNDAGIPYSYNESVKDTGLQILNSAPPENCDVYVPLSAYAQACELLKKRMQKEKSLIRRKQNEYASFRLLSFY